MTEPLTPPDCDLRDFAFMPLHVARLLDSDLFALSTGDEFKAAISLWCKAWLQVPAGSLPDDDRVLAHLSGAGSKWKRVKAMALRGFIKCSDGRLYHSTVSEKANEAMGRKASFRERSRKGNEKRWGSQKDSNSDPLAIPEGVLKRPKGQGQGQGQYSVSKDTGTATVLDFPKNDPKRHFWESAKAYLGPAKGGLVGKWARDFGQDETAKAITAAQVHGAVDPVPYIEKMLRGGKRSGADVTDDGWELPIC
ncbi:MAG TPA: DUF1376 domain-containing protein [Novosphingobium sp.]|nr:DUF1376 domain-containing protein [Novosphingobium sp.]